MTDIKIRKAVPADCERMMELVRELAVFEKAPDEVTVSLEHFIETGFGKNPVWEALLAVVMENNTEKILASASGICGIPHGKVFVCTSKI